MEFRFDKIVGTSKGEHKHDVSVGNARFAACGRPSWAGAVLAVQPSGHVVLLDNGLQAVW